MPDDIKPEHVAAERFADWLKHCAVIGGYTHGTTTETRRLYASYKAWLFEQFDDSHAVDLAVFREALVIAGAPMAPHSGEGFTIHSDIYLAESTGIKTGKLPLDRLAEHFERLAGFARSAAQRQRDGVEGRGRVGIGLAEPALNTGAVADAIRAEAGRDYKTVARIAVREAALHRRRHQE